ncbi:MAG: YhbY family RNA-binding protein [Archaeoglobaceae archaeon]
MEMVKINVGKKGITESLINEINLQLEKRGIVKVKLLRNFESRSDRSSVGEELAKRLGCKVKDVRGFVITLER